MWLSCAEFADALSSKQPTPGGGGASAYVGALSAALGAMVGHLTLGKAKYADVQDDIEDMVLRAERLRRRLQDLVTEDALSFAPLAGAYGLPDKTEAEKRAKAETLESALKAACDVPLEIMKSCCEAIELNAGFMEKGSKLAISDAGAGAVFGKAALTGASLNIFINTKLMKDRPYASKLNAEAEAMIAEYGKKADATYASVRSSLGTTE
ncbi:MAG: cyclodeaminase/cyclohydrolase family protein [Clostridiales Family XIII bacterium]|nr:cyclodeaminase/cyclohydrolase family protein [Clostridiales Family XIII bacterium]